MIVSSLLINIQTIFSIVFFLFSSLIDTDFIRERTAINVALGRNLLKTLTNIGIMEKVIKTLMLFPSCHIKCIK